MKWTWLLALLPALAQADPVTLEWDRLAEHDADPGIRWEVEIDGAPPAECWPTLTASTRQCTLDIAPGPHTFRVRAERQEFTSDWSNQVLAQVGSGGSPPGPYVTGFHFEASPDMTAALGAVLDSGTRTSNGWTTAPTFTAGRRGVIFVGTSETGGSGSPITLSASGGGVTWTAIVSRNYGFRRNVSVLLASGTPSGTITVTSSHAGQGSYESTVFVVSEIADYQSHDTPVTGGDESGGVTTFSLADIGTIDANDLAIAVFALEGGDQNLSPLTGLTEHSVVEAPTTGVRAILVGYTTTDDTPGCQWDNTGYAMGGGAFIVNGSAAAAARAPNPQPRQQAPFRAAHY